MTPPGFDWKGGRSNKVACLTCGRTGYSGGSWMQACQRGHTPCPQCGRPLSVLLCGRPRVHTRCPDRIVTARAAEVRT